jgi:transcriptional antiterminator RfaH
MSASFNGGWIVARSKPRQELYAKLNVTRQGFECYVPQFLDAITRKVQILFPGYLFVNTPGPWVFLTGTFGVMDVVLHGASPATLPLKVVDELKARENRRGYVEVPSERFATNQQVRLTAGPFAGEVCLYQGVTGKDRVKVLLSLLGRSTPLIVRERLVEAA